MTTTTTNVFIISAIVALIAVALGAAYTTGALDPVIEKIGVYFFKAEAKAEEKKLEAQGLKEGQDFFKGELKGNQQASEVQEGIGALGGLKKGF
ncbi:hypothetical protein D0Z07_6114 [Hyphodiscus hymeniophilus]|uniref:Uncharacterized protein n=1 Tax=Hyphodiscus hymeniophilus TaxID=353542 RepID=A0A9P6VF98_9HELO|nr:hypothetical protein D0Z07_6114 [Hyphodiscus hymeniophilus]